jgi:triosephosphate isomerase (TIM)
MNLNIHEITEYEKILRDYDVIVMPQTPYIGLFKNGMYHLGSQCISEYNATGGVSAIALSGMKVEYVMVGHSERRQLLNENDYIIIKKINEIVENKMTPIMCVGENKEDKIRNKGIQVIEKQIANVFNEIKVPISKIIIAYEPVWLVGSDINPNINEISKTIMFIKSLVKDYYGINIKILYGGNVNSKNISELLKIVGIDGFLIGQASLDIHEVIRIYNKVNG